MPPERLLAHEGFLRALAVQLVGDPSAADDVVQGTWLTALERPPAPDVPLQGWLATVARNVARMGWRGEARRRRREQAVARPEAHVPSVEAVRARERARQAVVEAVLRLDTPHRDAVLLRFYEGLPPREVAARLDLPLETVRTRLRRAVERLRADLDRGQTRAAWRALLLPLARPVEGHAAALSASALGGAMALSLPARASLVVVLLAFGGGAAWLLWGSGGLGGRGGEGAELRAALPGEGAEPSDGPTLEGAPAAAPRSPAPSAPAALDLSRRDRPRTALRGQVLSGRTHKPVEGARVLALPYRGVGPPGMGPRTHALDASTASTDADGRFTLEGLAHGAWFVQAEHEEQGRARDVLLAGPGAALGLLYLMPEADVAGSLRVRVVDEAGNPQAQAVVEALPIALDEPFTGVTNADGVVELGQTRAAPPEAFGLVTATSQAGVGLANARHWWGWRSEPGDPLQVVVRPAGSIRGAVVVPPGLELRGAHVVVAALEHEPVTAALGRPRRAPVATDGAFHVAGLASGPYVLRVEGIAGWRVRIWPEEPTSFSAPGMDAPGGVQGVHVQVDAGVEATVRLELVAGATLRGRVVDERGAPVVGARVQVHLPQGMPDGMERMTVRGTPLLRLDQPQRETVDALGARVLTTDDSGRYEVTDLLPGTYRVHVTATDRALGFDVRTDVAVRVEAPTELEHRLPRGGTLELTCRPHDWIGLRRAGQAELLVALLAPLAAVGAVTLEGLPVGRYEACAVHADPKVAPVPLTTFEIVAGRITYVSVSELGDTRVRLRVLERDRPVVGARVYSHSSQGRSVRETDAEGRVTWAHTTFGPMPTVHAELTPPGVDAMHLRVTIPAGGDEAVVSLPTATVRVRVQDAAGGPSRAGVTLSPVGSPGADVRWTTFDARRKVHEQGSAAFVHVPPGRYTLLVVLPKDGGTARRAIEVGSEPVEVDVRVAAPATLRIRVRGVDGGALAGARLSVQHLPPGDGPRDWRAAADLTQNGWQTDAQGEFVLPGVEPGWVRVGSWVMEPGQWSASANAQAEVEVRSGQEARVELDLKPVPR